MAFNDTYLLSVKGKVATQDHVHTLHFRCLDPVPGTTAEDLVEDYMANAAVSYRSLFRTGDFPIVTIRGEMVCGSEPLEGPHEVGVPAATGEGTRLHTDTRMTAFMAALFREKGAFAGRKRQGRFFISGMGENDIEEDAWNSGYLTTLQGYATTLTTRYVGNPPVGVWQLVVHSKSLAGEIPALNCQDSSTRVQSLSVSNMVTTMRSRKVGHGS